MPFVKTGTLIASDNEKISFRHYSRQHKEVIVIAHGFFNSKDSILLKALKSALIGCYDVIMFDFRGHGKSSGLFSWTSKECFDLERTLVYARQKYKKVGLIAFSLGASIAINLLSKKHMADSFVAVSAPSEFEKIDFKFWKLDFENDILFNLKKGGKGKGVRPGAFWLKKDKPISLVSKMKTPVLYIHGDKDWVVGCQHSLKLFNKTKSKKEYVLIAGGPHAEYLMRKHGWHLVSVIKAWFQDTLKEGGKRSGKGTA